MKMSIVSTFLRISVVAATLTTLQAQTIPVPRTSQRAEVSQWIGVVKVTIAYSSPNVTAPDGENRADKVWGGAVPFGLAKNPLGANPMPWRAGANENTTFTISHDVNVEGKTLAAGTYGLHVIPEKTEWTIVFSKNATSWGSFSYSEAEDVLRVTIKPQPAEMHEWLTYEFIDRKATSATVALFWEKLKAPIRIDVPNINELHLAEIRNKLRSSDGFIWQNLSIATNFVIANKLAAHYPLALTWIDRALTNAQPGAVNFNTLRLKAQVLQRLERKAEADSVITVAMGQLAATPPAIAAYGTWLLGEGKKTEAMNIFKLNATKNPNTWASDLGLARMHSAQGDFKEALKYAEAALKQAPEPQKKAIQQAIEKLKQNKDMN